MLEVYLDDSGSHGGSRACVVGGYYGKEESWKKFSKKWDKILQRAGVEKFHARRFWGRDGSGNRVDEYKHWTDDKADIFLAELLNAICKYHVFPIAHTVDMKAWETFTQSDKIILTGGVPRNGKWRFSGKPTKPMFLPFRFALEHVARRCPTTEKVHIFFGIDQASTGWAMDYVAYLKSVGATYSKKLGNFVGADHEAAPLQAADLLAYQVNQHASHKLKADMGRVDLSPILRKALYRRQSSREFLIFDRDAMDMLLHKTTSLSKAV